MMNPLFQPVFIGLGSNLGNRALNIERALQWMDETPGIDRKLTSAFLETPPWGVTDQPSFINAVTLIQAAFSPHDLLAALKSAEAALGRFPDGKRWGPRIIDLDILLFGQEIVDTETLTIPHPRITERDFIMAQIVEIDKTAFHPKIGRSIWSIMTEGESA